MPCGGPFSWPPLATSGPAWTPEIASASPPVWRGSGHCEPSSAGSEGAFAAAVPWEYARILGIGARDLTPSHFAAWPLVVSIDGRYYVRSIERANPDGSLTFFCAIENGLVLRMAKGLDLVADLEQTFSQIRSEIGPPQLVLGCDCILRKLEIFQNSLQERVGEIFLRNNTIGFNTYGEQFLGVHINQTLVGIAIGTDSAERNDEGPGISNV